MVGTITRCWLFVFQMDASLACSLLPSPLELVTHNGLAFWNVVVCAIQGMKPKLSPFPFGFNYWHVAYRLYVRCHTIEGQAFEGLYFLRSDSDNALLNMFGNLVTDFNFHTAKTEVHEDSEQVTIAVRSKDAPASAILSRTRKPELYDHSAFASLDEAATFLKYKPNGISPQGNGLANIVHIVRNESEWRSRLLFVESAQWSYFNGKPVRPEICYEVEPIFYQWSRGQTYKLIFSKQKLIGEA
jgi:hypothetical protein